MITPEYPSAATGYHTACERVGMPRGTVRCRASDVALPQVMAL